ncbi:Serpin-like protein [Rhynchospora pubera]|uniref:Serpin-like protein n=1 Tax=Rhynchospora pubera TaxID=906938 RepID=A0AAV8HJD9_9POAL|nr:Serpin-like protein [Rhynchospora pubera]
MLKSDSSLVPFGRNVHGKRITVYCRQAETQSLRDLVAGQSECLLRLSSHVSSHIGHNRNFVFSPLSFHAALSLVTAGAKGRTFDQLHTFLCPGSDPISARTNLADVYSKVTCPGLADGSKLGGPSLACANGVWLDKSFKLKQLFKTTVSSVFKADVQSVDFLRKATCAVRQVNSWVENVTKGLIKDLLLPSSVDQSTVLALCNAIHFKGTWAQRFDKSRTVRDDFHLLDGTSVKVPFMSSEERQYISKYTDFSVLRLPYNQGRDLMRQFSMYIFLPNSKDGIRNLAEKLYSGPEFLNRHLPTKKIPVSKFLVPKFKISFEFEGSEVLKGLGVDLIFGGDRGEGGLSEMVETEPHVTNGLTVSNIFHKAFIEVNEEGTEAAAATAVSLCGCSPMIPQLENFVANHPFLYLIREDMTGVILFVGHVMNPAVDA